MERTLQPNPRWPRREDRPERLQRGSRKKDARAYDQSPDARAISSSPPRKRQAAVSRHSPRRRGRWRFSSEGSNCFQSNFASFRDRRPVHADEKEYESEENKVLAAGRPSLARHREIGEDGDAHPTTDVRYRSDDDLFAYKASRSSE